MLYPEIEPYHVGHLKVSEIHTLYYEEVGNPKGKPVVFLHGGPGGGVDASYRRYFNPAKYRVILFDQRGCGKSTPHAEIAENTTWDLVEDIERLRKHIGVESWMVFGGSWGSTLAICYGETYPKHCTELVLRGIFLMRRKDIEWFYQEGTSRLFPDLWDEYLKPIPANERNDMISAYYKRLTSPDRLTRVEAAKAWSIWEGATSKLRLDPNFLQRFGNDQFAEAFARIECHYFTNDGFLDDDNQLIDNAYRLKDIPGYIVHGRYDVICPADNAWDLKKAWPNAELHIIPDAGHSISEPGIQQKLIEITDRLA